VPTCEPVSELAEREGTRITLKSLEGLHRFFNDFRAKYFEISVAERD